MRVVSIFCFFLVFVLPAYGKKVKPFCGKEYYMPFIHKAPKIDGVLEKQEWSKALKIGKFYQVSPGYNVPPTVSTVAYMAYDSENLYLAFDCSIKGVDNFLKLHLRRDEVGYTERVSILLDTFCEYKKAYIISFDPYGEIMDGIMLAEQSPDLSQDFDISSRGKIYKDHYVIEAKISFRNFKFKNKYPLKWGFTLDRSINYKKMTEEVTSVKVDRNVSNGLEFEDYLIFKKKIGTRGIYFIPEIVSSYNRKDYLSSDLPSGHTHSCYKGNVGGTFFFRPDSETRLGITVNPDFSEVEADDIKFDANHRFPIFYEEKRPFFLESSENFSNRFLTLFNSRNIIAPDVGGKFIREWGKQTIASLYAIERNKAGDRFGLENSFGNVNWYILRYKYKLKGESYLGFYSLNRKFRNSQNNVLDVDGVYRISKRQKIGFMGLYSRCSNSPIFSNRTVKGGGWDMEYAFTSRYFNFSLETLGLSDQFIDDAGFISRNNYWYYSGDFNVHYEPENDLGKIMSTSVDYEYLNGYDFMGNMTDRKNYTEYSIALRGGHIFNLTYNKNYELYLNKGYNYTNYRFSYWCNHFKRFHFGGDYDWGDGVYYDEDCPQSGSEKTLDLIFRFYPLSDLFVSCMGYYGKMDGISGKLYGFDAAEIEIKYQYTQNSNIRMLYKYKHYNYPLYDYSENYHFVQIVQTYNPRAYTAIYVGFLYGKDHNLYHPYDWDYEKMYKFFVKVDYMFNIAFH